MSNSSPGWLETLAARPVWWRAARIALPVGLLQDCINQGDHWLRGDFSREVVAKSLLTPCVTLAVAFISAASTHRYFQSKS